MANVGTCSDDHFAGAAPRGAVFHPLEGGCSGADSPQTTLRTSPQSTAYLNPLEPRRTKTGERQGDAVGNGPSELPKVLGPNQES